MGNYTELYYHFVWATKNRQPLISFEVAMHLHGFVRSKCTELGGAVFAVNGMPDHLHIACSLPATVAISVFVEKIKGASAHFINRYEPLATDLEGAFHWQSGFGALTFARRDLARIVAYVDNQQQRHADGPLSAAMERFSDESRS